MPNLEFVDRDIDYQGNTLGQYALDENGRICAVVWKALFRKFNSFSFSAEFLESIEAEKIYIVSKDSDKVYLFSKRDYLDGPLKKINDDYQYILSRDKSQAEFSSLDEILK